VLAMQTATVAVYTFAVYTLAMPSRPQLRMG
jgi:hypothetical protein